VSETTERTRIRRLPEKASTDRDDLDRVLDAGLVAHVTVMNHDVPLAIPVAYARRGDEVLFHGSTGSRLFRTLSEGAPTCLTVTLLDGLVVARSAFESSMHYRSAMLLGTASRISGDDELDALRTITEHLLPGRWQECRQPNPKERAATMTLSLPIEEWSLKLSDGDPDDEPADVTDETYGRIWAGVVPLREEFGAPRRSADCPDDISVPEYVRAWRR
jgi:nitroimidazol reductase NimA-like FMN-containing flavoprotein (pyridoxamine 5'-phosphate oxidase superfamily)